MGPGEYLLLLRSAPIVSVSARPDSMDLEVCPRKLVESEFRVASADIEQFQ